MPILRIFPYRNFSDNEHWIDGIDQLSKNVRFQIMSVVSAYGTFEDRGDRFEIPRKPSEQELAALSSLCKNNDIRFLPQVRTDEEWKRETGKEFPKGIENSKMR